MKEPYAVYIGWQRGWKDKKLFKLYNVVGGELHNSTVSEETLKKNNIKIKEKEKEH